ncbi:MAG: hypothetical protein M3Y87_32640 [Myxococcota bacterium]|nr:hypothetical protein [Myxococcota bacterium]
MSVRRRLASVVALATLAACAPGSRELSWQARFADPDLRTRARALEVEIRTGGCTGPAIWSLAFAPSDPPASMGPPELGPGTYGFAIAARDGACERYALGCTELVLPQEPGSTVVVTLEAFLGGPACAAGLCTDGLCGGMFDGGVPDADAGEPTCPAGRGDCNGIATDGCETVLDTVAACGACGTACELDHAAPECTAGRCAITACDEGWSDCNGIATDGCETSLRSTDDCGACGATCQLANAAESCQAMRCELVSCYAGFGDCDGAAGTGCETSLITASDCGACGTSCGDPVAPLCGIDFTGARACVAACTAPTSTTCGTSCVDTASDPQSCGACSIVCRADHAEGTCSAGTCGLGTCDPLWSDCNGLGSDGCELSIATNTDCGACGAACAATTARVSCAEGTCVVDVCDPGLGDCDGVGTNGCESDLAAPITCGSCDESCAGETPVCGRIASGERTCLASCVAPDPDRCGSRCFDTSSDVENCGGCGLVCTLANASTTCVAGECSVGGCLGGFGDCDGIDANGCESQVSSDPANCGACGNECPSGAAAEARCVDSACTLGCEPGFGDCDDDEANGCETSLETPTDCGGCDQICDPANATGACEGSSCRITSCDAGFGNCDGNASNGCETPLQSDRQNCGMCGNRCSGGGALRECCGGMCGACP